MVDDGKRLDGNGLDRVWQAMQVYVQDHQSGGGSVTSITAGDGLSGGTITTTGTIALKPASENELGGVKVYYDDINSALYINSDSTPTTKSVNFYDYDGTLLYSYTKPEFLALTSFPANPTHTGLSAQGWNWTLANAKSYVETYDYLDIGQSYTTSDGKTRIYISLTDEVLDSRVAVYIQNTATTVTVDWGDNSTSTISASSVGYAYADHTYSTAGDYIVALTVNGNYNISFGKPSFVDMQDYYTPGENWAPLWSIGANSGRSLSFRQVKKIEIGNKVNSLGATYYDGLYYYQDLETITIPTTLVTCSDVCFRYTFSLKNVVFPLGFQYPTYGYDDTQTKIIPSFHSSGIQHLCLSYGCEIIGGWSTFEFCNKLKNLCLPNSITTWDELYAPCFRVLTNLEYIIFPNSIVTYVDPASHFYPIIQEADPMVGDGAFGFTTCLKYIHLPSTLTKVGSGMFSTSFISSFGVSGNNYMCLMMNGNPNLTSIIIPNSVTEIGEWTFAGCTRLKNIYLSENIDTIGIGAFAATGIEHFSWPSDITIIPKDCFGGCSSLTTFTMPNTVTEIEEAAFFGCTNLEEINLSSSLTTIGSEAFSGTLNLKEITLPDSVTSIGTSCFSFTGINIIHMSPNITNFSLNDFYTIDNALVLDFSNNTIIPTLSNAFGSGGWIVVPDSLYSNWINATNWSSSGIKERIISVSDYKAQGGVL